MPYARRSHYLKVRDRNSYAFALVSVAAVLDLDRAGRSGRRTSRWAAWRTSRGALTKAEKLLIGKKPDEERSRAAAEAELRRREAISRQCVQSGAGAAQHRARGDHSGEPGVTAAKG